jgi:Na+/proline symporter
VYIVFIGALISAILSTVDSALLAASALVSHNLILPMVGTLTEAGKVRVARSGVFVFGIAAYGLALTSDGVSSLVEEASAFGGASIFTVAIFGMLTTRFGRARSALAALFGGMLSRIGAEYGLHLTTPFLASLGIAAGTYVLVALFESRQATQALEGASP